MSDDVWLIAAAVPPMVFALVLALRAAPQHWSLRGPQRRARDAQQLFRWVNAAGRHVSTFRRLFAIGPFTVYVARYKPGHVDDGD
ncbi:hypothetical protein ACFFX1_55545 [Dactylosporangium sucinum]|uniref:Uncharacterized protein n=1 Tax=Dactylosporangium sucinum TaxID=1424081 RepID=A0A917U206_9ACTN|nr:hypothetical protein [Dactylosporangium sucinum]GGM52538.1 hypothetical protein GCM10007977_062550 [Dactylosporangium sucinum]